nr:MAG TPA: hypothetical protein [Bacteriophage sp.]
MVLPVAMVAQAVEVAERVMALQSILFPILLTSTAIARVAAAVNTLIGNFRPTNLRTARTVRAARTAATAEPTVAALPEEITAAAKVEPPVPSS